jgi:hypothetical protein
MTTLIYLSAARRAKKGNTMHNDEEPRSHAATVRNNKVKTAPAVRVEYIEIISSN